MASKNKSNKGPVNEPRYVISVAARMLGTQTYTLRYYERIGIIEPSRSGGNIRLYSENDITRLKRVKALIEDLGINLAGVEVILHMAERMEELQRQVGDLEKEIQKVHKGSL
jgi:MerR family transcriptional regulator, heat shock protein HspR